LLEGEQTVKYMLIFGLMTLYIIALNHNLTQ